MALYNDFSSIDVDHTLQKVEYREHVRNATSLVFKRACYTTNNSLKKSFSQYQRQSKNETK